jgi:hypothetical protein
MAKDIQTINNDTLGPVPRAAQGKQLDASDFTSGLAAAFPVLIAAGKWGVRFGGEDIEFTEADPRAGGAQTPVSHLDVVMVASQTGFSKAYYAGEFDPTKKDPPTCWSADGIRPDDSLPNQPSNGVTSWKQSATCGGCDYNSRGSKLFGTKKLKACPDLKRVAVVRPEEIDNPLGPILLRITPSSQSNLRNYVQWLQGRHRHPSMVVTRMTFDTDVLFKGKIKFHALRGLTDDEYDEVLAIQEHPQINAVLTSKDGAAFVDTQQEEEDAAGGLPPTGGLPPADAPAKPGWEKTATVITPPTPPSKPEPKPALTPEQQELARLRAENEALKAKPEPEAKPEPKPVLTPEQMELAKLRAENEALKQGKPRGRPRSKPVGPPTGSVTTPSNGSGDVETSAGKLSNDLDSMIDKLAPKAP